MSNAQRDGNSVPTLLGVLNSDGATIVPVKVSSRLKLKVSDGATGSDHGPINALKDENGVSTLLAISSVDGKTLVPVYADVNGNLLINSN